MTRVAVALLVVLVTTTTSSARPAAPSGSVVTVRDTRAGYTWLELRTFPMATTSALTPRPVPGEQRSDCCARFSPDGTRVAFQRATPRTSKLLLLDLRTRRVRTVAQEKPQRGWAVAWSHDSRSLLYATGGVVRRADADGSGGAVVSAIRGDGSSWPEGTSPDGATALVVESFGDPIYFHYVGPDVLHAVDRGGATELARTKGLGRASWSPDGTWVAYSADCYSRCRLEIVRPDATQRRVLSRFATRTSPYGGFDELPFTWGATPGEIVYGRGLTLYGVDAASGRRRVVRTLPCPRRRCEAPDIWIVATSRDRETALVVIEDVADGGVGTGDEYPTQAYLVSLVSGAFVTADALRGAVDATFAPGAGVDAASG